MKIPDEFELSFIAGAQVVLGSITQIFVYLTLKICWHYLPLLHYSNRLFFPAWQYLLPDIVRKPEPKKEESTWLLELNPCCIALEACSLGSEQGLLWPASWVDQGIKEGEAIQGVTLAGEGVEEGGRGRGKQVTLLFYFTLQDDTANQDEMRT